jgi:hypothetical protein
MTSIAGKEVKGAYQIRRTIREKQQGKEKGKEK